MKKRSAVQLILALLLIGIMTSFAYGAYLTHRSHAEVDDATDSPGEVEIDVKPLKPIVGLEAREDHIGEIRVWTYSNDTELVLQLAQASQTVTSFREFTVEICQPLDMILVIDLSDSMLQFMDSIKKNLTNMINLLSLTYKAPLRFGVVGFKDFDWETVQLFPTDDCEAVKTFINNLTAEDGAEDPESHYLGLGAALKDFNLHSCTTNAKVVIFISDTQAGYNNTPSFDEAKEKAEIMAELGIRIDTVLCGADQAPQSEQLQHYANVTGGQFIGPEGQNRIVSGATSHPTWKVTLTPIAPLDFVHLRLNSSPPSKKEGYYTFYVHVSLYANAIGSHDSVYFKIVANLQNESDFSNLDENIDDYYYIFQEIDTNKSATPQDSEKSTKQRDKR